MHVYMRTWAFVNGLHHSICGDRGQPQCLFWLSTLFGTRSLTSFSAYTRLTGPWSSSNSPASVSHLFHRSTELQTVNLHLIFLSCGDSNSTSYACTACAFSTDFSPWPLALVLMIFLILLPVLPSPPHLVLFHPYSFLSTFNHMCAAVPSHSSFETCAHTPTCTHTSKLKARICNWECTCRLNLGCLT